MSLSEIPPFSSQATDFISSTTVNLHHQLSKRNLYGFELNRAGNIIFLGLFTFIAVFNIIMVFRSKQVWYSVCFILGFVLEALGYLGRVLGFTNNSSMPFYILQSLCLTIAPAFIMAGIYFLFAQNVAVHGRKYSLLKPMWYSYFFIGTDVLSIFVQGAGGGMTSTASSNGKSTSLGNTIMFVGILIQIVAITFFLLFWFIFLGRTFFHDRHAVPGDNQYKKKSIGNYFKLLVNIPSARSYKLIQLDPFYNPQYQNIRYRALYSYYPLAVSLAVVLVYIRCVYRVVELKQGYSGYLMSHEIYLFVFDSLLIAETGLIFIPFHPMFVFGRDNVLTSKDIKNGVIPVTQEFIRCPEEEALDKEKDFSYAAQKREAFEARSQL
ncbi:hypothetical protein JCM33374_g279 [Metschnikowia sp. JCM 33374]|nr:hypothetical protein JCM33374_g279 [Metschnikowia sp. JCM 33374]